MKHYTDPEPDQIDPDTLAIREAERKRRAIDHAAEIERGNLVQRDQVEFEPIKRLPSRWTIC